MDNHRLPGLRQYAVINSYVILNRACCRTECAACHQNNPPVVSLNPGHLLFIGSEYLLKRHGGRRLELVCTAPASDERIGPSLSRGKSSLNQFPRLHPRQPCTTLRRIHRFGDTKVATPQILSELECCLPINRIPLAGFTNNVCGGIGYSISCVTRRLDRCNRRKIERFARSVGDW